jgi:hypothetical protein
MVYRPALRRKVYHLHEKCLREGSTVVRVLLVLTAFAVLLCGCGQENTPVQKQEKKHGVEQAASKPATEVKAVTEPSVSKPAPAPEPAAPSATAPNARILSGEQAALAEAYCRMVTYASKSGMSQQEVRAFIDQATQRSVKEMEDDPSLSAGAAGNEALDDLEVPRYTQCEVGGD